MKFKEVPKFISDLFGYWRAMGQLNKLWKAENYHELISFCNAMLSKIPTDYLPFYFRGLANEKLKLFAESIEDYEKAEISLRKYKYATFMNDDFIKIPIQISRVYLKLQDKEKAFEYADKAVDTNSSEIEGLKWRAALKEDFGDYVGASEDLNEALKRKPNNKALVRLRDRLTHIIIEENRYTANR